MSKVSVYIDGFNLYHAIAALEDQRLKWVNFKALAESFLRPGEKLERVAYFTAVLKWDKQKQDRHVNFIAAQRALRVDVIESHFRKLDRHCRQMDRYCRRDEEKQTDVSIALEAFADAMLDRYDRAILITADSDQVPLVRAIRAHFPTKHVTLAVPPGRGEGARELGSVVHDRTPIHANRLRGCLLPQNVYNLAGKLVAQRPAVYSLQISN